MKKWIASGIAIFLAAVVASYAQGSFRSPEWWHVLVKWPEGVTAWAVIGTGFVICWQAVETRKAACAAELAAEAAFTQAEHTVTSERPFVLVETMGTKKTEFWLRNCGRTPAQILFLDPMLQVAYPEFVQQQQDWVMENPAFYGLHFDNPNVEQINVPWLAPGEKRQFATFDPAIFDSLPLDLRGDLNRSHRRVRIYQAIKYKGLFTPKVYETRFCYGWSPAGTHIAGSFGYNLNT